MNLKLVFVLTCLFSWRKTNARISHVHETPLRKVYSLCFDELLKIDKLCNMFHKNIQTLGIELYKANNNLSNQIMQETLRKRQNVYYSLTLFS